VPLLGSSTLISPSCTCSLSEGCVVPIPTDPEWFITSLSAASVLSVTKNVPELLTPRSQLRVPLRSSVKKRVPLLKTWNSDAGTVVPTPIPPDPVINRSEEPPAP